MAQETESPFFIPFFKFYILLHLHLKNILKLELNVWILKISVHWTIEKHTTLEMKLREDMTQARHLVEIMNN